jgi:hypothetical protein
METNANQPGYLCVDRFLAHFMDAQALGAAFELGVIDCIESEPTYTIESLGQKLRADPRVFPVLVDLLRAAGVLSRDGGALTLNPEFQNALLYRDLMLAKLDFARIAAFDLLNDFSTLVRAPREFMARARMFRLFSYGRCFDSTPENLALTQRWVRITTALTRYEAAACFDCHDLSGHRRMLDIGGNSGEFAIQACRRHPDLRATIYDLPVVCEIGREHVATTPEGPRISFVAGNAMVDPLPSGCDLITFKSVLHDWPDAEALQFMQRAWAALPSGGTLLIYERSSLSFSDGAPSFALAPIIAFAHSYREPKFYEDVLREFGAVDLRTSLISLEVPFFVTTARKP